jgi:hypothetical protein
MFVNVEEHGFGLYKKVGPNASQDVYEGMDCLTRTLVCTQCELHPSVASLQTSPLQWGITIVARFILVK